MISMSFCVFQCSLRAVLSGGGGGGSSRDGDGDGRTSGNNNSSSGSGFVSDLSTIFFGSRS